MTSPGRFFPFWCKIVLATGYLVVLGALPSLLSMAAAVWLVSSSSDLADARWGCIFTGFNGTPKIWEHMGEVHQKRRNMGNTWGKSTKNGGLNGEINKVSSSLEWFGTVRVFPLGWLRVESVWSLHSKSVWFSIWGVVTIWLLNMAMENCHF